jgi:hypothetical protein
MDHGKHPGRGRVVLLVAVAAVAALALAGAAVAGTTTTPTVTIVGPQYVIPSGSPTPTTPAPAVHSAWVDLYFQENEWSPTSYRLSNDGGTTWSTPLSFPTGVTDWYMYQGLDDPTLRMDGNHTVTAQFSNDSGATWGASASATTLIDTQDPVVTAPEGYWNNTYQYTLSAHDQVGLAGVQDLWYGVDSGALTRVPNSEPLGTTKALTASFDLPGETGTPHTVFYAAMDYAGNYSFWGDASTRKLAKVRLKNGITYAYTSYVVIDRTAPEINARGGSRKRWRRGPVLVRFTASDADAGVALVQYSVTSRKAKKHGPWTTGDSVIVTQRGRHKVWFQAIDAAQPQGNASALDWVLVKIR